MSKPKSAPRGRRARAPDPPMPVALLQALPAALPSAAPARFSAQVTQTDTAPPFIRVRGRSFMALGLAPEPPLADWLAGLDAQLARAPAFFDSRPVVLDLSALPPNAPGVDTLVDALVARGVRLVGVEGGDLAQFGDSWGRLPLLTGGRGAIELTPAAPQPAAPPEATPSLLVERPVRSGQSVVFPQGDLTIVGSVASGAEVSAGGSIHVYGALRGRAIAGILGNSAARIFCRKLEAELLAIDGLYRTADDLDSALLGRAVQARLVGDALRVDLLD